MRGVVKYFRQNYKNYKCIFVKENVFRIIFFKSVYYENRLLFSLNYQCIAQYVSKCRRQVACYIVVAISGRSSLICPVCQCLCRSRTLAPVTKHWINSHVNNRGSWTDS